MLWNPMPIDVLKPMGAPLPPTIAELKRVAFSPTSLALHFTRQANASQKGELEAELASMLQSEKSMQDRIHTLETELLELHPILNAKEDELDELKAKLSEMRKPESEMMKTENQMRERINGLEFRLVEMSELKAKIAEARRTESMT